MNDLTILVNSCDLYSSVWEPFFRLFKIQWPDCPYDFVLNTETKKYAGSLDNVRTINTPNAKTWSQRFKNVLEHIETEYVLFMLDDYFVLDPINVDVLEKGHSLIKNDSRIGMVALIHSGKKNIDTGLCGDSNYFQRVIDENFYITCVPAIWRREYLLKIIRDHETIWEFEKYATYRMMKLDYIVINQRSNTPQIISYKIKVEDGIGVTCKKWLPGNKTLFEKYDIPVDFDELGLLDERTITALIASREEKTITDKHNNISEESARSLKERLYRLKHFCKRKRKQFKKLYREYLSKR